MAAVNPMLDASDRSALRAKQRWADRLQADPERMDAAREAAAEQTEGDLYHETLRDWAALLDLFCNDEQAQPALGAFMVEYLATGQTSAATGLTFAAAAHQLAHTDACNRADDEGGKRLDAALHDDLNF